MNQPVSGEVSASERIMQLVEQSEDYIGKMGRWCLRGAVLTIILCLISAISLLVMFSDPFIMHDIDLQWMFIGAIVICQFVLIFWWSVYVFASMRDKRRSREWWDRNIRPLKERDAGFIVR